MHETCARFRLMLCYFCETIYQSVAKDRPAHTGMGLRGAGRNSIPVCVPNHSCRSGEDWIVTHCNSRVVTAQTRRRRRRMQLRPQLRPRQRQDRQHIHIHSQIANASRPSSVWELINWIVTGSYFGLSPIRCQVIIWSNSLPKYSNGFISSVWFESK